MKILLFISALLFIGCEKDVMNTTQNMRLVASNMMADVYVVNIDGKDYIVVTGVYKAAICPK